jgi:MYXO-CTERM domain-containing protein
MVLTYDAARQQTLLFGGFESSLADNYLGDTWTWDGSIWTQHATPTAPSARVNAAAAYDPATRLVYLYGGTTASGDVGDLWAWDGSVWQLVEGDGSPSDRAGAKLAWDSERRRGVLFGGSDGSPSADFWELSLVDNECTSSDGCHTGVCDGSRCVAPASTPEDGADAGIALGGAGGSGGSAQGGTRSSDGGSSAGGDASSTGGAATDAGSGEGDGQPEPPGAIGAPESATRDTDGGKSLYGCAIAPRSHSSRSPTLLTLLGIGALLVRARRQRLTRRGEPAPAELRG